MKNILLCTLGESWAVIPEVYGFLAPDRLPLYREHPQSQRLNDLRAEYGLKAPDEIWICTTEGQRTHESLSQVHKWQALLAEPIPLRIWQAQDTDDLASQEECEHMRELILRAALLAHDQANGGQVVLSLAGGRKTMSADMQWAGSVLGCQALIHVIAGKLPDYLFKPEPSAMTKSLPVLVRETDKNTAGIIEKPCVSEIMPLVAGRGQRSELLDVELNGEGPVSMRRFPLPMAEESVTCLWPLSSTSLANELKAREKQGSQLLGNYLHSLSQGEHHENWRSLYRLPPRLIDHLRKTPLSPEHRDWLNALPKADLHRHLGGSLHLPEQRSVGQAIWDSLTPRERADALAWAAGWLREGWPTDWPTQLRSEQGQRRAHRVAALLVHENPERLEDWLYASTEPRLALKERQEGFAAYERPGELSGSAVLSHSAAIEPYALALVRQARSEGLAYVELRGSPQKYGVGLDFLKDLEAALARALTEIEGDEKPLFRFNLIADRRQRDHVADVVKLAVQAKNALPDFIAGLDLAGDEGTSQPHELAQHFLPAFEACLPVTIHAGEGEAAESIWQAAYHLHADRIGHGLSLGDHEKLTARFRDRGICLELCPTSNREVVGFSDPKEPTSADCPIYPLATLWNAGLPLTLCTDNPGISRTTLTDEYLTAARMVEGGITCWDALAMLKQGFVHSFLDSKHKEMLTKKVDASIYQEVLARFGNARDA